MGIVAHERNSDEHPDYPITQTSEQWVLRFVYKRQGESNLWVRELEPPEEIQPHRLWDRGSVRHAQVNDRFVWIEVQAEQDNLDEDDLDELAAMAIADAHLRELYPGAQFRDDLRSGQVPPAPTGAPM